MCSSWEQPRRLTAHSHGSRLGSDVFPRAKWFFTCLYHWIGGEILTWRRCFLMFSANMRVHDQNPRLKRHSVSGAANFDPDSCWLTSKNPTNPPSPNPPGLEHFVGFNHASIWFNMVQSFLKLISLIFSNFSASNSPPVAVQSPGAWTAGLSRPPAAWRWPILRGGLRGDGEHRLAAPSDTRRLENRCGGSFFRGGWAVEHPPKNDF